MYRLGIDAGSTTVKFVILDDDNNVLYKSYKRHLTKVKETIIEEVLNIKNILNDNEFKIAITGSSGYGVQ